eukprot:5654724-Amphidinium_carterae.1
MDTLTMPRMKVDTPNFGAISMMSLNATSAPMSSFTSPERNSFAKPAMQCGQCGGAQSFPMTPAGPAI